MSEKRPLETSDMAEVGGATKSTVLPHPLFFSHSSVPFSSALCTPISSEGRKNDGYYSKGRFHRFKKGARGEPGEESAAGSDAKAATESNEPSDASVRSGKDKKWNKGKGAPGGGGGGNKLKKDGEGKEGDEDGEGEDDALAKAAAAVPTCAADVVAPLWKMPYMEQLQLKDKTGASCYHAPFTLCPFWFLHFLDLFACRVRSVCVCG